MPAHRPLSIAIVAVFAPALLAPAPVSAATLTVDTTASGINGSDGACSLREAILNSNADDQSGSSDCSPGNGADQIVFDAGVFAGTQTLTLTGGELPITAALTLTGPGADRLIIDAGLASRHFNISDGAPGGPTVVLSGITLRNGQVTGQGGAILAQETLSLSDVTLSGNTASASGGALAFAGGDLTIAASAITGNLSAGRGGGAQVYTFDRTVTISDSTISGNTAAGGGFEGSGGIGLQLFSSTLTIERSAISGNTLTGAGYCTGAGMHVTQQRGSVQLIDLAVENNQVNGACGRGGGAFITSLDNAQLQIASSVFAGNTLAGSGSMVGAGMYLAAFSTGTTVTLENSTFSGNSSGMHGGGLYAKLGDGIDARFHGITVSGNSAAADGGGMMLSNGLYSGQFVLSQSTISDNHADADATSGGAGGGLRIIDSSPGAMNVVGSVIAANSDGDGSPDLAPPGSGTDHLQFGDSLIGDNSGTGLTEAPLDDPDGDNNLIGDPTGAGIIDPRLLTLAYDGASVPTQLPQADSPLLDHFTGCSGLDARGAPRGVDIDGNAGNDCDIGAVERQPLPPLVFRSGFEFGEGK